MAKDVSFYLSEHQDEFPGVEVVPAAVRDYPNGTMAAHVLGWVGQINAEEIKDKKFKNYGPNDLVGKTGLEQQYEKFLRGRKGRQKYLVDSNQQIVRLLGEQPAVPGDDLVLSLDINTQRIAEQALSDGIANTRAIFDESQVPPGVPQGELRRGHRDGPDDGRDQGAGVVAHVRSLVVRAEPDEEADRDALRRSARGRRRSIARRSCRSRPDPRSSRSSRWPPSRTASRTSAATTRARRSTCIPGDTTTVFHNWTTANLGTISVERALQISCDTVFYQFGADFYDRYNADPLGHDATLLQDSLRQFGFGTATKLDLPLETTGLIPDPNWKKQFAIDHPNVLLPEEQSWLPGDDIQMAIGQGFVTITPMQLAVAYSAIANGGKVCRPHVVDHIEDPDGATVHTVSGHCNDRKLPYTQAELDYIRNALATVTQSGGTASSAFAGFPLSQVPVAGKTGTAQRPPFQDTSWFAAMVPANDPKYVIIAMVEQGGHGSTSAAPIVRQVIEGLYGIDSNGVVNGGSTD